MARASACIVLLMSLGIPFCIHRSKSKIWGGNIRKILSRKLMAKYFLMKSQLAVVLRFGIAKGMGLNLLVSKIYFHSLVRMCASVSGCHVFLRDRRPEEGMGFPAAGFAGSSVVFDVSVGNGALVL